jgi:hypothetical protein
LDNARTDNEERKYGQKAVVRNKRSLIARFIIAVFFKNRVGKREQGFLLKVVKPVYFSFYEISFFHRGCHGYRVQLHLGFSKSWHYLKGDFSVII